MPINKEKNVMLQITIPKEVHQQLCTCVDAFNKEGIPCTKSTLLVKAFNEYLKCIVACTVVDNGGKRKC